MQFSVEHKNMISFLKGNKDLWKDSRSFKSLLADIIPEDKSIRHILQIAYDEGIVEDINRGSDIKRVIYSYQKIMTDDYLLNRSAADLSLCIWLEILGFSSDEYSEAFVAAEDEDVVETLSQTEDILDPKYMKEAGYYESIVDLNEYLADNPDDEKARYEYISVLYDTLVEPDYVFKEGEAEYIATLCINNISKLKDPIDRASRHRLLRAKFAKATCLLIIGELIEAYDLFCEITHPIDELARELGRPGCWADILFRSEANIHQIKELCGIDDGGFFSEYKEEIKFFEAHVAEIAFTYDDRYCLPTLIPLAYEYKNAFYQTFNSKGDCINSFGYGGQFFALNQAKMNYSGKYSVKFWPINLYSGVSEKEYEAWTWNTVEKKLDRNAIQNHIMNHPYKKVNGYIAPLLASNNRRNGR